MQKNRKKTVEYAGVCLLLAIIYGVLFELQLPFFVCVLCICLICVPKLVLNQQKYQYETNRFQDVNFYMSQMSQSFLYTTDVIASLQETASCFLDGRMRETLTHVLMLVEEGGADIKNTEREALLFIESKYNCERLRNLHAFFLNTEELGGDCHKEFRILESMRIAWQKVVESMRIKRYWDRNIGAIIYGFFLFICIIMLHIMRDSGVDIMGLWVTQIIDALLLIGFVLFYLFMDSRLTKSLLEKSPEMTEQKANEYYIYLEHYNPKLERKKYREFVILSVAISVLFLHIKPTWVTLAFCLVLLFMSFHVHELIHRNAWNVMRREVEKAFPKWLFDVMLLLQRESVEGAIEKSMETAPPVLRREISRIVDMFYEKPHNPEAYVSFLGSLGNQDTKEMMRRLYSLAIGTNRDSEVLDVVVEKNIQRLEIAERNSMIFQDTMKSFLWIPFLCMGFACIGYLVIAITTTITEIIQRIA